jgi:spermidine/putrescine transport system substrate-binding protein
MTSRRTFLLGAAGACACSRGGARLNVYNWSDYVAPDTIPNFEREFGVRVRYGTYEDAFEMLAKLMTGNSGWDVAFPSAEFIPPMSEMGLLAPLDHSRLSNLGALEAEFQHPPWDPTLAHCVPYLYGVTGIAYQRSLGAAPTRWSDLWDPQLSGRITMLNDSGEVLGACLKKLGCSLNSGDTAELARAQREAIAQKHLLRAYLNAEAKDQLVAGDVTAAQAWAVTAGQAIAAAPGKLAFAFPAEGFLRYCDHAVILRESRRAELAHQFVNYLLRPEVASAIAGATRTATANQAGRERLPAELREDPVLYPPREILARGEWVESHPAAVQRLRDRLWTEIKSS